MMSWPLGMQLQARYHEGEYRARLFADMVLRDLRASGPSATVLDIGCGAGVDGDQPLQREIISAAGHSIGVEPDPCTSVAATFSELHRCSLESASIPSNSVDLAYAVMVLEHVQRPSAFFQSLARVMKSGGVFWGFTVDLRHWSSWASLAMEQLKLKRYYFRRFESEYQHFPVAYRLNSPRQISKHAIGAFDIDYVNLSRIGSEDSALPRLLRPLNHLLDRLLTGLHAPGANLACRAVRK